MKIGGKLLAELIERIAIMSKMQKYIIVFYFIFISIGTGVVQLKLKELPQLILIGISVFTLLFLITKRTLGIIFLGLLIAIASYVTIFWLIVVIKNGIWSDNLLYNNGVNNRLMNDSWFFGFIFGVLISSISVIYFIKHQLEIDKFAINFVGAFLTMISVIFLVNYIF